MNRKDASIIQALLKQAADICPQGLLLDGDEIGNTDMTDLSAAEYSHIMNAVPKRQMEFISGRKISRRLLLQLGYSPALIPRGEHGNPIWPTGIVGSITHTDDYCLVALGKQSMLTSVGIDLEHVGSVEANLWSLLFTDAEIAQLNAEKDDAVRNELATILFTAKEAFYKYNYPIDGKWLDFKDINVGFDRQSNKLSFLSNDGSVIGSQTGFSLIISKYAVSIVWCKHQGDEV